LNNIDSLIQTAPKAASTALITLSDMLRYMIYDTKPDKVSLEQEIAYLKNYISLQQLRFRNKEYISASFTDQCQGVLIAPMLFVPFVENAFKYASDRGELPVIQLSLHCNDSSIEFSCRNNFGDVVLSNLQRGGVGLTNVKRRLELLYPGKYHLKISNESYIFGVELTINLK
jgi:LytS/YehU family sensor histidine kinase